MKASSDKSLHSRRADGEVSVRRSRDSARGRRPKPRSTGQKPRSARRAWSGISQLTLVEHSLCPLDAPRGPLIHEPEYSFYTRGRRRTGRAEIRSLLGLKPEDEFYLWGILALVFSEKEPDPNYYASARYLLERLGLSQGGKSTENLRNAIHRLGNVRYRNGEFYDPVRKEHRDIGFGFWSYDLPMRDGSLRPWRISIDPVFFDFCKAAGGFLAFDLEVYRELRPASRRLFLFIKKLFYRNKDATPYLDVRDLAVHTLGFSDALRAADYNRKVCACSMDLAKRGMIRLPEGEIRTLCEKVGKGNYRVRFHKGPHFVETPHREATR